MEPLTITDAKHAPIVAAWLDKWLSHHYSGAVELCPGMTVSVTQDGWAASVDDLGYQQHASHAALVAYVVAWAREQED